MLPSLAPGSTAFRANEGARPHPPQVCPQEQHPLPRPHCLPAGTLALLSPRLALGDQFGICVYSFPTEVIPAPIPQITSLFLGK